MNEPKLISIIVTTYNWPDALQRVLLSIACQTYPPNYEVIVADDGSRLETKQMINEFVEASAMPIKHVWQADEGFRAARVRNLAIQAAKGDYLIFIDGDCIVRPTFVYKHSLLAQSGYFVAGNRVLLNKEFTAQVLNQKIALHVWGRLDWLKAWVKGYCNRFLPFFSLPAKSKLRLQQAKNWQGAKGCNLAIWKQDLLRVNGWEESFQGWGYEDSDLVIRLLKAGIKRKSGKFSVPVIHLWHLENDRSQKAMNKRRLENILSSQRIIAEQGLTQEQNTLTTEAIEA